MGEEEYKEEGKEEEDVKENGEEKTPKGKKKMSPLQKKTLSVLLVVLLIAGVSSVLTFSLISKYPETFGLLKGPSMIKKEEKALVSEISKSLTLPADEEPTIATVTDPEKLSAQFFFKNVQKGDKLLIYQNSKKVILYRPSENRVIEVGVVNVNQEKQLAEDVQTQTYKMAILNSTKDTGIVASLESKTREIEKAVVVSEKGISTLSYNESFIVDVKGDKKDLADKLAAGLSVKTGNLPDAEKKLDVDFILLIGSDLISD